MLKKEVLITLVLTSFIQEISMHGGTFHKFNEAVIIAHSTVETFGKIFLACVFSAMPSQKFLVDDLRSFVNYPSKTTVGFAPKFTNNRRFFANMISTNSFKNMLAKDVDTMRQQFIAKLKYCDEVVMDENRLKDLYDREVDQTKI